MQHQLFSVLKYDIGLTFYFDRNFKHAHKSNSIIFIVFYWNEQQLLMHCMTQNTVWFTTCFPSVNRILLCCITIFSKSEGEKAGKYTAYVNITKKIVDGTGFELRTFGMQCLNAGTKPWGLLAWIPPVWNILMTLFPFIFFQP